VLAQIVHLLHPIMPFVTEVLWTHLAGEGAGMLITAPWPALGDELVDRAAMAEMDWVVEIVSAIRSARSEMNVPAAKELPAHVTESGTDGREWIGRHRDQIRRLARLSEIELADAATRRRVLDGKGALQVVVGGATVLLDLAGAVDLDKERARLAKEKASLAGELEKIAKKLGNEQFLAKAKPEVIDEQRERQAELSTAVARVDAALARLG
jgi:valyl-tRNA synthetase